MPLPEIVFFFIGLFLMIFYPEYRIYGAILTGLSVLGVGLHIWVDRIPIVPKRRNNGRS